METYQNVLRIRSVRRTMSGGLLLWSGASMLLGALLMLKAGRMSDATMAAISGAVGSQFFIWGFIDALFAIPGLRQATKADRNPPQEPFASAEVADRDRLLNMLTFSQKLNYVWVATGVILLLLGVAMASFALGAHGVGVLIQGGFLFLFDRVFFNRLRDPAAA